MPIRFLRLAPGAQQGVSLLELVVFMVVVAIASSALFASFNYSVMHTVDPLIQVRALELAQAKLDEILALKYDANTPTGGIPACDSTGAVACNNSKDADMNDVDDYDGITDTPFTGYSRSVTVVESSSLKLITVTVAAPNQVSITLAAYRANF
jgi:MSHA pilin protein MshD